MTKRLTIIGLAAVLLVAIVAVAVAADKSKPVLTLQYQKMSAKCDGKGSCVAGAMHKEGGMSGCAGHAQAKNADDPKKMAMDDPNGDMSAMPMHAAHSCMSEKEVKRAYSAMKKELAAEGVKVKLQKVKGDKVPSTSSQCGVWISGMPIEYWMGSKGTSSCCGDKEMTAGSSGCTDMIVMAGHNAADYVVTNGNIDPAELSRPKGCGGCKDKAACGGGKAKTE